MVRKSFVLSIVVIAASFTALAATKKKVDPDAVYNGFDKENQFDLREQKGRTFLDLMVSDVSPAMDKVFDRKKRIDNDAAVDGGNGVTIRLDEKNISFHVNYKPDDIENSERSGRSYGVGPDKMMWDASDKDYLDELETTVSKKTPAAELKKYYTAIVQMIANADSGDVKDLSVVNQGVITDFMAVYAAEEKRHINGGLGSFNWDDALFQVTMVAAYHGGQTEMYHFYEGARGKDGKFTNKVVTQYAKLYGTNPKPKTWTETKKDGTKVTHNTVTQAAKLDDYWQFSTHDPNRSGINLTRSDFVSMGNWITKWERDNNAKLVSAIDSALGESASANVFSEITTFFIDKANPNKKVGAAKAAKIASAVADFLVQVRTDAPKITDYVKKNAK